MSNWKEIIKEATAAEINKAGAKALRDERNKNKEENNDQETQATLDADYNVDEFNLDEQLSDDESDEQSSEQIVQKNIDNINLDYKIFTTQFDEITKALTPGSETAHVGDDRFKKPNHPTFSKMSKYYIPLLRNAGKWKGDYFNASKRNGFIFFNRSILSMGLNRTSK